MGWTIVHEDGSVERGSVRDDDTVVVITTPPSDED